MVKVSNEKLVNSVGVLSNLSATKLPIKISYAVAKNISKIEAELKVYNAEREKLIEKYSVKDEEGKTKIDNGTINIQEEYLDAWNKEHTELLSIENDIDIHLIPIDELLNSMCNIAPSEIIAIDYLIQE